MVSLSARSETLNTRSSCIACGILLLQTACFSAPNHATPPKWVDLFDGRTLAGWQSAGRQCAALVGSLVSVSGHKLTATYRNVVTEQVDVPDALREIFGKWSFNTASSIAEGARDYSQFSFFSRKLAALQADLIRKLSSVAMVPLDDVLAVGLLA